LRSGKIFGAFNEQEREAVWAIVISISSDRLIPSFYSYFEDMNYFKGPAKCVKSLIELSPRDSISSALLRAFRDGNRRVNQYVVQESESRFVLRPGDISDGEDFALRQMWIIAMRYSEAKLDWKPSKATLCEIAAHAYRLGFKSTPIFNFMKGSADRQIALKALLEARKPDRFKYDAAAFEDYVDQMVGFFSTAEALTEEEARTMYEIDHDGRSPKRCGIPKPKDHEQDKLSLFLDKLHDTSEQQYPEITSFFVRRSIYFAFWGKSACVVNHDTAHERFPEQEILERGTEEEMRDFTEQQQLAQPAEQERRRQKQAEQEKERQRQAEEEQLARLVEERRAKEQLLNQLIEQTRAEEGRLAQLAEQRRSEEGQLVRLAEERERQRHAGEKNWIAVQERQSQAEEERRRQADQNLFEEELFEEDNMQETRTSRRQRYLAKPQPDRASLASLWNPDRERTYRKKPKPPRGIGAARKKNGSKRITQIDLREVIKPATQKRAEKDQVKLGKQIYT
jgi:hypothetical protein